MSDALAGRPVTGRPADLLAAPTLALVDVSIRVPTCYVRHFLYLGSSDGFRSADSSFPDGRMIF